MKLNVNCSLASSLYWQRGVRTDSQKVERCINLAILMSGKALVFFSPASGGMLSKR
jgi:hypothetical protein